MVFNEPGIKVVDLQKRLNVSRRTITSDLKRLDNLIVYMGSKKEGGYKPSKKLLQTIDHNSAQ
ncbi:HTH domain-containing protein [Cyclonatronum proteinivorum]|uniref:HTH domain-containing protein n=1 Tax=Cyclonatronum proteinivorum TaxID=1457365 RepID=A0A345UFU2_9BACT|nr:HTH domain-containing protein [Cyclonatronum proteinivorum]